MEGAENLKKALNFYSELNQRFEKAYVYANQLLHQDMANGESQEMFWAGTGADESGQ